MDYIFPCFLPLTLKISKLPSKSEPKTPQGFWLWRDTSYINVGREKVDKQPVGKCEEIIFISWCFQHVASVSDVQKYITAWKFTIPIVVIIQCSRCETLKMGTFSLSPSLFLSLSLSLFLYSNLRGLKWSFTEIKHRDLGILMNGSIRCGSLKNETDAALLLLFPLSGYFYFFLSQKSLVLQGDFSLLTILFPTLNTKVLCSDLKVYNDSVWTKLQGEKKKKTWTNYNLHLIVDPIEFF